MEFEKHIIRSESYPRIQYLINLLKMAGEIKEKILSLTRTNIFLMRKKKL